MFGQLNIQDQLLSIEVSRSVHTDPLSINSLIDDTMTTTSPTTDSTMTTTAQKESIINRTTDSFMTITTALTTEKATDSTMTTTTLSTTDSTTDSTMVTIALTEHTTMDQLPTDIGITASSRFLQITLKMVQHDVSIYNNNLSCQIFIVIHVFLRF